MSKMIAEKNQAVEDLQNVEVNTNRTKTTEL